METIGGSLQIVNKEKSEAACVSADEIAKDALKVVDSSSTFNVFHGRGVFANLASASEVEQEEELTLF